MLLVRAEKPKINKRVPPGNKYSEHDVLLGKSRIVNSEQKKLASHRQTSNQIEMSAGMPNKRILDEIEDKISQNFSYSKPVPLQKHHTIDLSSFKS